MILAVATAVVLDTGCATNPDDADLSDAGGTADDNGERAASCECTGDCEVPLCEPIVVSPGDLEFSGAEGAEDEPGEYAASITCALEALRDGATGSLEWDVSLHGGTHQYTGGLTLKGDGTAVQWGHSFEDLCETGNEISAVQLKDVEHFEACLEQSDAYARWQCIREAGDSVDAVCQAAETICGEG